MLLGVSLIVIGVLVLCRALCSVAHEADQQADRALLAALQRQKEADDA